MRIPKIDSRNLNKQEMERLVSINFYVNPKMMVPDWEGDDKTRSKFIKKIESVVRKSMEYRDYIKFLKEEVNMNNCAFLRNLDRKTLYGIRIEIHHAPFTLYDITDIILNYMKKNDMKINERTVAEEVLKCHYQGLVGLIPLSLTVHELVHSGEIFIPVNKVYGNVQGFIDKYKDGLTDSYKELIETAIEHTESLTKYSPSVLEKKITYLKVDGMEFPRLLESKENKVM